MGFHNWCVKREFKVTKVIYNSHEYKSKWDEVIKMRYLLPMLHYTFNIFSFISLKIQQRDYMERVRGKSSAFE